ncbi:MAG: hypothetical protein WC150_13185 [Bacteroidia bacterium]
MHFKKACFFSLFLLILPIFSYSQGDGGGNDPDVPVDGGISLLLAAGAGYAVKKLRDNRSKNDESNPS